MISNSDEIDPYVMDRALWLSGVFQNFGAEARVTHYFSDFFELLDAEEYGFFRDKHPKLNAITMERTPVPVRVDAKSFRSASVLYIARRMYVIISVTVWSAPRTRGTAFLRPGDLRKAGQEGPPPSEPPRRPLPIRYKRP